MRLRLRGLLASLFLSLVIYAQRPSSELRGTVRDALGRVIAGASLQLVNTSGVAVATGESGADGIFRLAAPAGFYHLRAAHTAFANADLAVSVPGQLEVTLDLAPVQQSIVVSATGAPTPESQLGQAVSHIDGGELRDGNFFTIQQALRYQPGVQVEASGALGGVTSVFVRGGDSGFAKVLLDAIPVERADFGYFDYSTLTPVGVDSIEIVRGPDSVIYGSDAMSGVVNLTTRRAEGARTPELDSETEVGNFATTHQTGELLGSRGPLDGSFYFGYVGTHNQVPNNHFRDATYGGNAGWRLFRGLQLRTTGRYTRSFAGNPNAIDANGIADDSFQRQAETYAGISLNSVTNEHWQNWLGLYQTDINYVAENPSPTGIFDPSSRNYLGRLVTLHGANGYTVTGQAILDFAPFPPFTYPSIFPLDNQRRGLDWRTVLDLHPGWRLLGGYRYYDERGLATGEQLSRHDHGGFAELNGSLASRLFVSGGVSVDRNTPFRSTTNPQVSLAVFPRLTRSGFFNETRLRASGGSALKDPSLLQQESSLVETLFAAGEAATVQQLGLQPIRPERGRAGDAGIDQFLAAGRVRLSETLLRSRYFDLIEDVPPSVFPLLGLPNVPNSSGASVNSEDESIRGSETELLFRSRGGWHARASYSYIDAKVTRSFNSSAHEPVINPAFPNLPIGANAPLVGARPFRRAPHSGSFEAGLERTHWAAVFRGFLAGKRDDSTFLLDRNFGSSMLLPNRDLLAAYQVFGFSGFYRVGPVRFQAAVDNLFDQHYAEAFGYPSLGRAVRVGISWRLAPGGSQ